jgi:hypothetical protein
MVIEAFKPVSSRTIVAAVAAMGETAKANELAKNKKELRANGKDIVDDLLRRDVSSAPSRSQ